MMRFFRWFASFFQNPSPAPVSVPVPDKPESEQPPGVYMGKIDGASQDEVTMIERAVAVVREVVASPEFQEECLTLNFTSTNGLSNLQIYEKFTKSAIVVNVTMFYGSFMQNRVWHTMGLDDGEGIVYANRYFVKDTLTLASLILHEVAHQLGFHHVSAAESTSVPYRMNFILEKIATQNKLV